MNAFGVSTFLLLFLLITNLLAFLLMSQRKTKAAAAPAPLPAPAPAPQPARPTIKNRKPNPNKTCYDKFGVLEVSIDQGHTQSYVNTH